MRKTALQAHYSCSMQKTDGETAILKKKPILKIGKMAPIMAKAIAFAKWSVFVKK